MALALAQTPVAAQSLYYQWNHGPVATSTSNFLSNFEGHQYYDKYHTNQPYTVPNYSGVSDTSSGGGSSSSNYFDNNGHYTDYDYNQQHYSQSNLNTPYTTTSNYQVGPFDDYPYYRNRNNNEKNSNFSSYLPWILSMSLIRPPQTISTNENFKTYLPDKSGPLNILHQWKQMDYAFSSDVERDIAISSGEYIPENNLPLGIAIWKDRIFITMPRWKKGIPATLTWIPRNLPQVSPKLNPYPNWDWHSSLERCDTLTSVFRIFTDSCGRLWVLDSGQVEITIKSRQICPPSIFIFDLKTDEIITQYVIPKEFVKDSSLYTNIVVDVRGDKCNDAFAYVTDVWGYAILVYSFKEQKSWRLTHGYFLPEPLLTRYQMDDLVFNWNDGIFGVALSPYHFKQNDRLLFYHPMSGSNEFYIPVSYLQNETKFNDNIDAIKLLGSRGPNGHCSASGMDRNGILYFNMVTRNSVQCWNANKPFTRSNLGIIEHNNYTMIFPNDLKIDEEDEQSLWVLSNKLPFFLYRTLDPNEINFRLFQGYVNEIIKGTPCDPQYPTIHDTDNYNQCI